MKDVGVNYANLQQPEHELPPPLYTSSSSFVYSAHALIVPVDNQRLLPGATAAVYYHHGALTDIITVGFPLSLHANTNFFPSLHAPLFILKPAPLAELGSCCRVLTSVPVYPVLLLSNSSTKGNTGVEQIHDDLCRDISQLEPSQFWRGKGVQDCTPTSLSHLQCMGLY